MTERTLETTRMNITLAPLTRDAQKEIMDIFNHYVENSFAAYPEQKLPYECFYHFLEMCEGYPAITAKDEQGNILGFGMLRAYNPFPTFSQTAEITYFIKPGYTGRGIGKKILNYLVAKAKEKGITSIIASISSLNDGSITFHKKNGFVECGQLREIGNKKGKTFDIIYMQKML
jgi:L-amino acid N-acyltransferase YncA